MDPLLQCPVCTLYLHNGMSLESHLDTHPKDQVIRALCSLSVTKSNYSSRCSTPASTDLVYRGRSQTPVSDENKPAWGSPAPTVDHDRYWRRTPSRCSSRAPSRNSRSTPKLATPVRVGELTVENVTKNLPNIPVYSGPYSVKSAHTSIASLSECAVSAGKYSKNDDYIIPKSPMSSVFASPPPPYIMPPLVPSPAKSNDYNRIEFMSPKPDNLSLAKTDLQYISPDRHSMYSTTQSFVRTTRNNIIMSGNICSTVQSAQPLNGSSADEMCHVTNAYAPPAVTQSSQMIYREIVNGRVDGKTYMPAAPTTLSTSLYPNLMAVTTYNNSQCKCLSYPSTSSDYKKTCSCNLSIKDDSNKTLVIEIGPNLPTMRVTPKPMEEPKEEDEEKEPKEEEEEKEPIDEPMPPAIGDVKGLTILSNVKVEVPVKHEQSIIGKTFDLTKPSITMYNDTEFDDAASVKTESSGKSTPLRSNKDYISNTFSVIKNIGNPSINKEPKVCPDKVVDTESVDTLDSCPVPDLICNEKPSISPCSEISENGDNAIDNTSLATKRQMELQKNADDLLEIIKRQKVLDQQRWNTLVRKPKKILKIKNAKFPSNKNKDTSTPSCSGLADEISMKKIEEIEKSSVKEKEKHSITVRKLRREDSCRRSFDTDNEAQSMDIEPVAHTSYNQTSAPDTINAPPAKNDTTSKPPHDSSSVTQMTPLESIRPMYIVNYVNMPERHEEESNPRELMELDAASKSKFVNLMSENYFGDNIYDDYFTPDKVDEFQVAREKANYNREMQNNEDRCSDEFVWGEQPQKEYALPKFSYNDSHVLDDVEFGGGEEGDGDGEVDASEQDSKLDVLSESRSDVSLDICANENMPPRGELSGQESNGDVDAPWNGVYPEVPPPEPYDLMARESWISDSSDVDTNETNENIEMEMSKPVQLLDCLICDVRLPTLADMDRHVSIVHNTVAKAPSVIRSRVPDKYCKLKSIKEEKCDIKIMPEAPPDTKPNLTSDAIFDELKDDTKPNIANIGDMIKKEPTKRPRPDYVCPTCKVDMLTPANFRQHLKIHPLECLTCGKCFYKRHNLNLHTKVHLGIKKYNCEVCEKKFLTRQKLAEHENVHTGRAPFRCPFCGDTFRRYSNMLQHRDRHHLHKKPKIRDFVCHCGEVFHSRAKLLWHKETHEEKPKACPFCSDKFIHTASLTRHIRKTHNACYIPEGRKYSCNLENVPCPICKQIYLRGTLKAHLQTHTDKRPFVCVICNKAFTTKWNLKLHKWIHMNRSAKPYKCNLCKGAFIRHSEYVSHMNAHKSVRPYTCNYCGCQFIRKYNCQRHVKEHELEKRYVCKVPDCGKAFHRSYYLTEHMRVHSGARPFSCTVCGKTSSSKSNHNKHVKVHHSRDPIATEA